ncbi:MAG: hypothetical protein NC826_06815 [Candidatus Omnitrophica bacterium]|nr:hypothetical protein [Candidatus Omnitrophota bacterium]
MTKKKAMTSEKASFVKRRGHADAREFAQILGIGKEYRSELQAKKDVVDFEGRSYSVKSGEKKWQIFLYGKTRFESDYAFKGMNGIGELFLQCITSFPVSRNLYLKNKEFYKRKLQKPMRALCKKLKEKRLLAAFIDKSMFNSGEVDFLVIKNKDIFHVFWSREVVDILTQYFIVENSKARQRNQFDDQKVIFKIQDKTYGEIEMRNDSYIHYREVKFWLDKNLVFELLVKNINKNKEFKKRIILYGKAINKLERHC